MASMIWKSWVILMLFSGAASWAEGARAHGRGKKVHIVDRAVNGVVGGQFARCGTRAALTCIGKVLVCPSYCFTDHQATTTTEATTTRTKDDHPTTTTTTKDDHPTTSTTKDEPTDYGDYYSYDYGYGGSYGGLPGTGGNGGNGGVFGGGMGAPAALSLGTDSLAWVAFRAWVVFRAWEWAAETVVSAAELALGMVVSAAGMAAGSLGAGTAKGPAVTTARSVELSARRKTTSARGKTILVRARDEISHREMTQGRK